MRAETSKVGQLVKKPQKGDVIRTAKHGDITVSGVTGYGRYLVGTDADGRERIIQRADDEKWLRITGRSRRESSAIPEEAVRAAAEVLLRSYCSEYDAPHLRWHDFADQAREVLEAAMPPLAKAWGVAGA